MRGKKNNRKPKRSAGTRAVNELVACQITERVAVLVQEMEGRYDEKPGFEMKATIYHEVLEVLNEGVEC